MESDLRLAIDNWLFLKSTEDYKSALDHLGNILLRKHDDPWVTDLLHARQNLRGKRLLTAALQANTAGNADEALKTSKDAETVFLRLKTPPLHALSVLQHIYALRRNSRAAECISETDSFLATPEERRYRWIEIQVHLERAACEGMRSDFAAAERSALAATDLANRDRFPILKLRALGLVASLDTVEGKLLQSWQHNASGLVEFWRMSAPPERGFQFYAGLEFLAEHEDYWHLAAALEREGIGMLSGRKRYDYEAIARMKRAVACIRAGDLEQANQEFNRAKVLMEFLPAAPRALYQTESEIELASVEISKGSLASAAQRLKDLESTVASTKNFTIQSPFWKAMAELERRRGNESEEIRYLKNIQEIGLSGLETLTSAQDKWEWEQEIGWANRRLLEIELSKPHDPLTALADWEATRNFDRPTDPTGAVKALTIRLTERPYTYLAMVSLPTRLVAWVAESGHIQELSIPVTAEALSKQIDEFQKRCSNPKVPVEKVKASGRRLYEQLVAPLAGHLQEGSVVAIAADDRMSALPWAALSDGTDRYFGQSHVLFTVSRLQGRSRLQSMNAIVNSETLIAVPGAISANGTIYPPLSNAEDESHFIAKLFPGSRILDGAKANRDELLQRLPETSGFHFAGHATTNDLGGELLLQHNGTADFLSAENIAHLELRKKPLVVLAACSTAAKTTVSGRNPFGLVRAFLSAGATNVVASRWDVDSQSTDALMREFYRNLHDGATPAVALQRARELVRSSPGTSHPSYWSAFELFSGG